MDQFLAYQRLAVRGHAGPVGRGGQLDHGVEVEPLTDHGSAFQHPPFVHVEPVETGGEQRGDRGWNLDRAEVAGRDPPVALPAQQPVVDQGRERLLDEQRVSRGRVGDSRHQRRVEVVGAHQRADQSLATFLAQRLQQHRRGVELASAPGPALLQQLGPGQAQQQDRRLPGPVGDMLDQVQQGRLGPVHVIEPDDQRTLLGERGQKRADRPEALLRTDLGSAQADQRRQPVHHGGGVADDVVDPVQQLAQAAPALGRALVRGHAGRLADHLHQRPVGDALAVGQAASGEHRRPRRHRLTELPDHPGFSDAGGTEQGEQVAGAFLDHLFEDVAQATAFPVPADHRCGEAVRGEPRAGADAGVRQADQAVGPQRGLLALDDQGSDRFAPHIRTDHPQGRVGDEDLVGVGGLLQPGRDVDRVPGHAAAGARPADGDLAGVDPDADPEPESPVPLQIGVERGHAGADLEGRAGGAQRVVLVQHGDAEDGEHRVPDELLDGAPVGRDHFAGGAEEPPHDLLQRFGVELFADGGVAGDVAEHDRDSLTGADPERGQRRTAGEAEARFFRVGLSACRAGDHVPDRRPRGCQTGR